LGAALAPTGAASRPYSLSGPPDAGYYRITVKRERHGVASGYLHTRLAVGDQLDIAAPAAPSSSTGLMHRRCWSVPGSVPPRSSPCFTRLPRSIPIARSGACTPHETAESTRSPPRPKISSRRSRTHAGACITAVQVRTMSKAMTSTSRGVSPGQCWLTSIHPVRPRHICTDRPVSWTRSAPP